MTELIDRYLWAVTRTLPAARRAEVSAGLRTSIDPAYFFDYRRLLIILLSAVTPSVFGAMVLAQWLTGNNNLTGVGIAFSTALTVAFQLLFWVTVVLAAGFGVLALLDTVDGFRRAYARVSRSRG